MTEKLIGEVANGRANAVSKVTKVLFEAMGSLTEVTDRHIVDGLITMLYSVLSHVYSSEPEGFYEAMDKISETLKERFKEDAAK